MEFSAVKLKIPIVLPGLTHSLTNQDTMSTSLQETLNPPSLLYFRIHLSHELKTASCAFTMLHFFRETLKPCSFLFEANAHLAFARINEYKRQDFHSFGDSTFNSAMCQRTAADYQECHWINRWAEGRVWFGHWTPSNRRWHERAWVSVVVPLLK